MKSRRRRVRFVVTTPLYPRLRGYCTTLGRDPSPYVGPSPESDEFLSLKPDYFRLVSVRLHECDGLEVFPGARTSAAPRIEHFRLIYEASAGQRNSIGTTTTPLKIFEFVPGARLSGQGLPNQPISVTASIKTNTSRRFEYKAVGRCRPDGVFSLVIPYPTNNSPYPVKVEEDFRVTCGQRLGRVAIDESAVQRGDTVSVVLSPAPAAK